MAITVSQAFLQFKSNLEITNLQTEVVSTRQKNVRDVVSKRITVLDSFLTGSYARNTLIAPLVEADIDICVILEPKYFKQYDGINGGPAGLLDFVKNTLRETYTRTPDISRNGQAVTIRFDDFMVDVVPSFHRQGGGYLIPNAITQNWIGTNPEEHVRIFSEANATHKGMLVPLIKMIKAWNKISGAFFRSFHLEVLALLIFQTRPILSWPLAVSVFFEEGGNLINKIIPDPAGFGGDVAGYLNTQEKINQGQRLFQAAHKSANLAISFELRKDNFSSIVFWKQIFDRYFPSI